MPERDLEAEFERLLRDCRCDSCARYRTYFAAKVREYTTALKKSMGLELTLEEEAF